VGKPAAPSRGNKKDAVICRDLEEKERGLLLKRLIVKVVLKKKVTME